MDLRVLKSKISENLRENGVTATTRIALRHLWRALSGPSVDDFDRVHGTDTSGELALWNTNIPSSNARFGTRYQATRGRDLERAVNGLGIDTAQFTFVDLGCGKGRALLVGAQLGFRQVVGVEFVRELVDTAEANLEKMGIGNAVVIHGDAAEYVLPPGNLLVYLYNPFGAPIVAEVIRGLENRIEGGSADEIYFVYTVPKCGSLLDQSPVLRRVDLAQPLEHTAIWKTVAR